MVLTCSFRRIDFFEFDVEPEGICPRLMAGQAAGTGPNDGRVVEWRIAFIGNLCEKCTGSI